MKRLFAAFIISSFLVAGCADPYGQQPQLNKQNVGMGIGALGGGLLGSQLGKGDGRLWTTGAGVLLGGLLGSSMGASLDRADQAYANQAFNQATTAPVGQPITWSNPQSGNSGSYVVNRTGRTSYGGMCREFTQTIIVGGQRKQGVGTACQNPDGSWQIQN